MIARNALRKLRPIAAVLFLVAIVLILVAVMILVGRWNIAKIWAGVFVAGAIVMSVPYAETWVWPPNGQG